MDWDFHRWVILLPGALLFCSCVAGLWWAISAGRGPEAERGARAVFTAEEPEGVVQDRFPAPPPRTHLGQESSN
jgi:hypothetical protein